MFARMQYAANYAIESTARRKNGVAGDDVRKRHAADLSTCVLEDHNCTAQMLCPFR